MANEFIVRTGLKVTGSIDASGDLKAAGLSGASGQVLEIGTGGTVVASGHSINQSLNTTSSPTFNTMTLTGDLNITGDVNATNRTDLNVTDALITVAAGSTTSAQADGAGLFISGANASIRWDDANSHLKVNTPIYSSEFIGDLTGNADSATNATQLNGQAASYYRNASNINAGTINDAYLPATISSNITGNAATATTATTASFALQATVPDISAVLLSGMDAAGLSISNLDEVIANTFNGTLVGTASHADKADTATSATTATNSTQLNGQAASYYLNASNINAGTINDARLPATITSNITGNAATATNAGDADLLEGQDGGYYLNYNNFTNTPSIPSAANNATITLAAGSGLTGGQAFTTNQGSNETITFNIGEGTGITVAADTISTNDSEIVHDNLSGFVANEHIDHSSVSINAGNGLTGGGNITATRTINVGAGSGISVAADAVAVDSTVIRTTGAQSLGGVKTFTDEIKISTNSAQASIIDKDDNTSVSTSTVSVHEIPASGTDAVFFDYVIKQSTTNLRAGTLMVVSNGSTVEYTETSTADIGNTSGVTLSADISGGNIRFRAVASSGTWTVRSLARTI